MSARAGSLRGLLVVIDRGKEMRAAVRQVLQKRAVVRRCVWHKRENVVSSLAKSEHGNWRGRLQRAWQRPTCAETKVALSTLQRDLEQRDRSAAASSAEGPEETLALQRLGVYELPGQSFKTTKAIGSVNAQGEERCAKVDHRKSSNQPNRWQAAALFDIEPRLPRVRGHQRLGKLRVALCRTLSLDTSPNPDRKAA